MGEEEKLTEFMENDSTVQQEPNISDEHHTREENRKAYKAKVKKYVKRILLIIYIAIIVALVFSAKNIWDKHILRKYDESVVWDKVNYKLADLEPYQLYVSKEDKELLVAYQKAIASVYEYDGNQGKFKKVPTTTDLQDIKNKFEALPEFMKDREQENFDKIFNLLSLRMEFSALFNQDGTLKENTEPEQVVALANNYNIFFSNYLNNSQDVAVTQMYETIKVALADLPTLYTAYDNFFRLTTFEDKMLTLKADVLPSDFENFKSTLPKLSLQWKTAKSLNNLYEQLKNMLTKRQESYDKYQLAEKYRAEQSRFALFKSSYEKMNAMIVDIPDLVGKSKNEAIDKLVELKLDYQIEEKTVTKSEKEDVVLEQTPSPNKYKKLLNIDTITLVVSKHEKPVEPVRPSTTTTTTTTKRVGEL